MDCLESEAPDLVLLDVLMPEMDGFAFCSWLRAQPRWRRLPVLMMTGLDDGQSVQRAFEVGATDFIAKPMNWSLVVQRVRFLLRASLTLEALATSREELAEAQRLAQLGSFTLDHDKGVLSGSDEAHRIAEHDPSESSVTLATFIAWIHPEDRDWVHEVFWGSIRDRTQYDIEHRLLMPDGRVKWVHERGVTEYAPAGNPRLSRGTIQDITERRESDAIIRYLSMYDGLTGLPNRTFFLEQVDRAISQAERRHAELAILHLGLDRFARVNDSFGHEAGDESLRQVAKRFRSSLRDGDTAGRAGASDVVTELARWGGDELVVLLNGVRSAADAGRIGRHLLEDLGRPYRINGQDVAFTASMGISIYPHDGTTATQLVGNASAAMNYAKEHERGGFHFYTRQMNTDSRMRLSLENDLRRALEHDELRLYYQPQVDRAGRLSGAEALVRWQHPEHGLMGPDRFIALAEESGLIIPLGEWVVQQACAQNRAWSERGLRPLRIAINLSATQFRHRGLYTMIMGSLDHTHLPGDALELELTESLILDQVAEVRTLMERFNEAGLHLTIDDFGTGYSSLSYLSSLPLHTIKVDSSFVREIPRNTRQAAIVRGIVALAKSLDLEVVAEGVETEEQAEMLRGESCDRMQGFLYDRPLPSEDFERWLSV